MKIRIVALCLALPAVPGLAQTAPHQPVLMISIDGMRPDYVTQADEHHLQIPTLRRMLAEGAHAEGVTGVFPTITYPSHTTLVTGVWPAEHGIVSNGRFDPDHTLGGAWYWYADQIKVPTLYTAAHAAGISTASVSWPVTVDATAIDFLLPEYWRTSSPGDAANPDDRFLMNAVSRPDGEVLRIAQRTSVPYMMGNNTELDGDEIRTVYSLDILKQHKPGFMTIHLSSLDEEEHLHGPFSAEADRDLEGIDGMVGRLAAQELENYSNAVVVIVSDHGFSAMDHLLNLGVAFVDAGLIQPSKHTWQAQAWPSGGMAAIMLHDPADTDTREKVRTLLLKLAADPANGIESVLDHDAAVTVGAFPDAAFLVTLKPGYVPAPALTGAMVTLAPQQMKGMHGSNPLTNPAMRASFFIAGKGIAGGKNLGVVDMRQIAPTVAALLGISLEAAKQPILLIH